MTMMVVIYIYHRTMTTTDNSSIKDIITEFTKKIDNTKKYELKELVTILTETYKNNDSKKEDKKKTVKKSSKTTEEDKPKRLPSSYNNFMKEKLKEVKESDKTKNAKDIMIEVAGMWKNLSTEEKEKYKTVS